MSGAAPTPPSAGGNPLLRFFDNIRTGGHANLDPNAAYRMRTAVSTTLFGTVAYLIFAVQSLLHGNPGLAAADGFFFLCGVFGTLVLARRWNRPDVVGGWTTGVFVVTISFLTWSGGDSGTGFLWLYVFPGMAFAILSPKPALITSLVTLSLTCTVMIVPALNQSGYDFPVMALRLIGAYVVVTVFIYADKVNALRKDREITTLQALVEQRNEIMKTMRDNMEDGIFLVDRSFIIQGENSLRANEILEVDNIADHNFMDLVEESLEDDDPQDRMRRIRQHFHTIFHRNVGIELLKDINPMNEVTLVFRREGRVERKHLQFRFSPKVSVGKKDFVTVIVADRTRETELKREVEAAETARKQEIEQFFQIFKMRNVTLVRLYVFNTEYNIAKIQEILDANRDTRSTLVEIALYVHAMRGDALLFDLENMAVRLSSLEEDIHKLLARDTIEYESMIDVAMGIISLKADVRKIKEMSERLLSFTTADNSGTSLFLRRLEGIIADNAERHGKHIRLKNLEESSAMDDLHEDALFVHRFPEDETNALYSKVVQDAIIQFTRNSIFHGIETVEERGRKGKDPMGTIHIMARTTPDSLELVFQDDGAGLKPRQIWEKARMMEAFKGLDPQALKKKDIIAMICHEGFSTAEGTEDLAGRGVGLSYVKNQIERLRGKLGMDWSAQGLTIKVVLPLPEQE